MTFILSHSGFSTQELDKMYFTVVIKIPRGQATCLSLSYAEQSIITVVLSGTLDQQLQSKSQNGCNPNTAHTVSD